MNDVLMLFFLTGVLFLSLCLIQSLCRLAASDSKRIRRCRQVAAILILDAVFLFSPMKDWLFQLCFWVMEAKELTVFRETVFVKRNYEMQYVLLVYILSNFLILLLGFLIFTVLERAADRGIIYQFKKLDLWQKVLHLPWLMAELCYEKREDGFLLRPWAAVLGKWIRNLSDGILILMGVQAIFGVLSIYLRLEWLSNAQGSIVFSGWYLVPSLIWLTAIFVGSFLEYCPNERKDRRKQSNEKIDELQEQIFEAAMKNKSLILTKTVTSKEWLGAYLDACFQQRKRHAFICHTEEQKKEWEVKLKESLSKRHDRTCLLRFGSSIEMQNQQDVDILILTLNEFIALEINRIFPFWYQQMKTVVFLDTHGLLSHVGGETDVVFSLWKRKEEQIQYLFFDCFGNAQEKQALEYFAGQKLWIMGEPFLQVTELLAWELDSQKAKMQRMLRDMQQEEGVSEEWLNQKKVQFGMKKFRTEAFLRQAVYEVFDGLQISNLYDSFLFIEEQGYAQSKWRIRLTDAGLITRLNEVRQLKYQSEGIISLGFNHTPIFCLEDQFYHLSEMAVLALGMEQEKKRFMLYQAKLKIETRGIFAWPESGESTDFGWESYFELPLKDEKPYEVTILRIMLSIKDAAEDITLLSALFSLVCDQVLVSVFPYHKKAIRAGSAFKDMGRSIFGRVLLDEAYEPPSHCVTVDLIETQAFEQGLTAVIRRNSKDFFDACLIWLEKAKQEPSSKEAALLSYAQKQLGKNPEEYRAIERLLALFERDTK